MRADIWFDFDGTLVKVEKRFYRVYEQICIELGLKALAQSEYWMCRCGGISTRQILSMTGSESAYDQFIERRNMLIEDPFFLEMDELRPGVLNVLKQLLSCKYDLYLITGRTFKDNLLMQMKDLSINSDFRAVHAVSPFGGWKEKTEVLRLHSRREGMIIGDSSTDILAGKKAGLRTCAIFGGMSTIDKIVETRPDHTIKEFREILSFV